MGCFTLICEREADSAEFEPIIGYPTLKFRSLSSDFEDGIYEKTIDWLSN